ATLRRKKVLRPTNIVDRDEEPRERHHCGIDPRTTARPAPGPGGVPFASRSPRLGQPAVAARRSLRCPAALGNTVRGRAAAQGTPLAARPCPTSPSAGSGPVPPGGPL